MDICRDAIDEFAAKLRKSFGKLHIQKLLLYMVIVRKINFSQMERHGSRSTSCLGNTIRRGKHHVVSANGYVRQDEIRP